jgi:hypothetical protein
MKFWWKAPSKFYDRHWQIGNHFKAPETVHGWTVPFVCGTPVFQELVVESRDTWRLSAPLARALVAPQTKRRNLSQVCDKSKKRR